ncbi:MAG: hypothetical protein FJ265_03605 [Planctomycetes bacterium]|nr:hypothetical protein [Planctomycetota bacterium]
MPKYLTVVAFLSSLLLANALDAQQHRVRAGQTPPTSCEHQGPAACCRTTCQRAQPRRGPSARTGAGQQRRVRAATPMAGITVPAALLDQLQGTLASEYEARDFYRAAAGRFGDRRFANLARAEQHHVDALTRLLRAAGAEPVTSAKHELQLPDSRAEAATAAERIERDVIAAYEVLLAADVDAATRQVFERIQAANQRHLAAAR